MPLPLRIGDPLRTEIPLSNLTLPRPMDDDRLRSPLDDITSEHRELLMREKYNFQPKGFVSNPSFMEVSLNSSG
jgi:hypothetical protein